MLWVVNSTSYPGLLFSAGRRGPHQQHVLDHADRVKAALQRPGDFGLTDREVSALRGILDGQTSTDIARTLGVKDSKLPVWLARGMEKIFHPEPLVVTPTLVVRENPEYLKKLLDEKSFSVPQAVALSGVLAGKSHRAIARANHVSPANVTQCLRRALRTAGLWPPKKPQRAIFG